MGSARLPGKVLRKVCGKPLLGHHLSRLSRARMIDRLVLATSDLPADDPIAEYCREIGVTCYRGDAKDLVSRYKLAVDQEDPAYVIRVTGDCPIIDPHLVDELSSAMLAGGDEVAMYSLTQPRFPRGLDAEIMTRAAFDAIAEEATSRYDREHVTAFLAKNRNRFPIKTFPSGGNYADYRWVVDYPEDLAFITALLETLIPTKPNFNWMECLDLLRREPRLAEINRHIIARYNADVAADQAADRKGQ
jgi:spore coat polysaccharide biosynthesis protein SpsF